MGTATETPLLTFEEFERLPEYAGKQELLKGELIELPPPPTKHARNSIEIFVALRTALSEAHARGEAAELGEVLIETGYHLDRHSWVVPDVSITHPGQREETYLEGAPAIAIEVVSPSNSAQDLDVKTELYFEHGAREVWRFYPKTRHFAIHTGSASQIRVEREAVSTPLLPGFSLTVEQILGK